MVAFWRTVLHENDRFVRQIERVPLSVREWDRQRQAYETERRGFDLGFAFFYLNRTNRSGIMNGGIIGGRKQNGPWGIDARFNRVELAARVRALAKFRLPGHPEAVAAMSAYESEVTYSAREASRGREIVVLGPRMKMPDVQPQSSRDYSPAFELI